MRFSAKQVILIGALALAALVVVPGTALAQPANDMWPGTAITSLPYSITEDTTQATTDSADNAAAQVCGGFYGVYTHSVWFAYTPASDQVLSVTTTGTSYGNGVSVVTGSPDSFTNVSCSWGGTWFQATQGTTYYIAVVDLGSGTGGTLHLSLAQATPPNPVLTVDSSGTFDKSGAATVSGTASCSPGSTANMGGTLTQPIGRLITLTGAGSPLDPLVCDGTPHRWSFVVTPYNGGVFRGGAAAASVNLSAWNGPYSDYTQVQQTIQLKH